DVGREKLPSITGLSAPIEACGATGDEPPADRGKHRGGRRPPRHRIWVAYPSSARPFSDSVDKPNSSGCRERDRARYGAPCRPLDLAEYRIASRSARLLRP